MEVLSENYFYSINNDILAYLKIEQSTFIEEKNKPHADRIPYTSNIDVIEGQFVITNKFKKLVSESVFPVLSKISVDLLNNYVSNLSNQKSG